MDSDTDIYNVWAGLLCKIKPLINRKVINQLQSFNAKMNNISAFKEIGDILQNANLNNGMISAKEERMINEKLEEIKNGGAINENELEKIKDEKEKEKRRKEKENRKKESQKKEKELPVTISEGKVSATEKPEEDLLKEKESEGSYSGESVKDAASHKELSTEKQVKEKTDKSSKRKDSFFKKGKARIKSLKDAKSNLDQFPWREWLELGKDIVICFFKHVLPQKLRGTITGYVTGIAAVFYPKYGESFSLYPDFERKVFAAQCEGKGRIRLGYILVLVVSILREKSVRTMIKRMILD